MSDTPKKGPGEIAEDIVTKADAREDIQLDLGELQEIAGNGSVLVDKAKEKLATRESLRHLAAEIREEAAEHNIGDALKAEIPQLEGVSRQIDDHASTISEPVRDAKDPDADEPGVLGSAKKMLKDTWVTAAGNALRTMSMIMKSIPNFEIFGIKLEQMNVFESLYRQFFGSTEARAIAAKGLKESGISVREGTKDEEAYGRLYTKYEAELRKKLRIDASGKSTMSQIEQDTITRSFTFEKYVESEARAYAKKFGKGAPEKGKERVTTLAGIAENDSPIDVIVVSKETAIEKAPGAPA